MKLLKLDLYPAAQPSENELEKDHLKDSTENVDAGGGDEHVIDAEAAKKAMRAAKVAKAMEELRLRQAAFTSY